MSTPDPLRRSEWRDPIGSEAFGVIHPEQGVHIARRLMQLLPLLDEDVSGGHIASMRDKTQQFIDGLQAAVLAGEDVEFG